VTLSYPVETPLWSPPPVQPSRPALWSARRTAVAVVAAVGIGSLTAVAVSYADTGSGSTGSFRTGQLQGPGAGRFHGGPFGRRQFGNGQFGQLGNGQFGNGQLGNGQFGQLGSAPNGLPGGR